MVVDLRDASEIRSDRGTVRYMNAHEHGIYTRKSGEISVCKVLLIHDKEIGNSLFIVELAKMKGCIWGYRGATGMPGDRK